MVRYGSRKEGLYKAVNPATVKIVDVGQPVAVCGISYPHLFFKSCCIMFCMEHSIANNNLIVLLEVGSSTSFPLAREFQCATTYFS